MTKTYIFNTSFSFSTKDFFFEFKKHLANQQLPHLTLTTFFSDRVLSETEGVLSENDGVWFESVLSENDGVWFESVLSENDFILFFCIYLAGTKQCTLLQT